MAIKRHIKEIRSNITFIRDNLMDLKSSVRAYGLLSDFNAIEDSEAALLDLDMRIETVIEKYENKLSKSKR